jgi:4-amino-4-deoxy-L-arabinose transferase-like glycosyltransferase
MTSRADDGTVTPVLTIRERIHGVLATIGRVPLWLSILVGVMARVAADFALPASAVDIYEFGVIAQNVVAGRGYSYFAVTPAGVVIDTAHSGTPLPSAFMPPLHTTLVTAAAAFAQWSGTGDIGLVWLVRAGNLVLAVVLMAAVAKLVTETASPRAARICVLLLALYPPLVYQATQVSASNTYLPVEVGLLAVLIGLARSAPPRAVLAAAALGGVLGLLRAEALVLLVAAAVWLALFAARGQRRPLVRLGVAAAFLALAVLPTAAWLARNSVTFGEPVLTVTSTGGFNLWIGNHPGASGSQKNYSIAPDLARELAAIPPTADYELRRDAVFAAAARREITDEPLATVARDGRKLLMMLTLDPYDDRSWSPAYLGAYALVCFVGVAGARVWWRRLRLRGPPDWPAHAALLVGWLVLGLVVAAVFFALARYRLPQELALLMAAAVLLARAGGEDVEPSTDATSTTASPAGEGPAPASPGPHDGRSTLA